MDIKKINIQMHMEEIYNSVEVEKCFEDRDKLKQFRKELYKLIDEINEYERERFETSTNIDTFCNWNMETELIK